jgi:hypothetical protein
VPPTIVIGAAPKQPAKRRHTHYSFDILCYGDWDLENGENGEAGEEGSSPAIDLREWSPYQRSCSCQFHHPNTYLNIHTACKSQHVQTHPQNHHLKTDTELLCRHQCRCREHTTRKRDTECDSSQRHRHDPFLGSWEVHWILRVIFAIPSYDMCNLIRTGEDLLSEREHLFCRDGILKIPIFVVGLYRRCLRWDCCVDCCRGRRFPGCVIFRI